MTTRGCVESSKVIYLSVLSLFAFCMESLWFYYAVSGCLLWPSPLAVFEKVGLVPWLCGTHAAAISQHGTYLCVCWRTGTTPCLLSAFGLCNLCMPQSSSASNSVKQCRWYRHHNDRKQADNVLVIAVPSCLLLSSCRLRRPYRANTCDCSIVLPYTTPVYP